MYRLTKRVTNWVVLSRNGDHIPLTGMKDPVVLEWAQLKFICWFLFLAGLILGHQIR
jgi:hypothetical protein